MAILPATLFAQETGWDGRYNKGDLSIELGLGFGAHGAEAGYGVALVPGAEWIVADWKLGAAVPLAMGVGAKGFVELIPATGLGLGADALMDFHLGFKGLDASKFIQNLDGSILPPERQDRRAARHGPLVSARLESQQRRGPGLA